MNKKAVSRIRTVFPYITVSIIFILLAIAIGNLIVFKKTDIGEIITQDVQKLSDIFENIHKEAGIISFDFQKNPINFLTIKKDGFVGSEVGSMNLAYPKKWNGPYVKDNLAVRGVEYLVVRTKKGYFITPGLGLKLPNGKKMGTDIPLDENASIAAMAVDENFLSFKGKPLAVRLKFNDQDPAKTVQALLQKSDQ